MTDAKKKQDAPAEKKPEKAKGLIVPEGKTFYVRRRKFKAGDKIPASLLPSEVDIEAANDRRMLKEKRAKAKG
jgi:hypothetical protein